MPAASFGAVKAGVEREPITFRFGVYDEHEFTVVPDPMLGDLFDLHDAPEPNATNELEVVRVLARFIRRMLVVEDRKRFDEALYKIPSTRADVIIAAAEWITTQVGPFDSAPPRSSSGRRRSTGTSSKKRTARTR